jgi:ATP-dependent protease ClpP protease subunit
MRSDRFRQFFSAAADKSRLFRNAEGQPVASASDATLKCQIKNEGSVLTIMMHDSIGDSWVGLDSNTVVAEIKKNADKELDFDINSFGGSAYDGIAIYNAAAQHPKKVTANITGIGYSAASIIPMAADVINIAENGSLGIHPAWLYTMGNRFALRDSAQWLETLDGQIIDTYAARTGRTRDEIVKWFEGENHDGTVFSGKQAVEYGFADALIKLKTRKKEESGESNASGSEKPANDIQSRLQSMSSRHAAALRAEKLNAIRSQLASRFG